MADVERHMEALSADCEKYLAESGMHSIADHKDETDPADIYTNEGELVLLQVPRDISIYYLTRLVEHGRQQRAKGFAEGSFAEAAQDARRLSYLLSKAKLVKYDAGWKASFDVSVNGMASGRYLTDFRDAIDTEAKFERGFIPGHPSDLQESAWLLLCSHGEDGDSHSVVLGVRDGEDWCEAGDWKAESTLDSVHSEGCAIVGWLPHAVPRPVLLSWPPAGNILDVGPAHRGLVEMLQENVPADVA